MVDIQTWLSPLDKLPLECDGMSRAISMLLSRDGVRHVCHVGSLTIKGLGVIPLHFWISLHDGRVCDFRARMWLGDVPEVPHGVFHPSEATQYCPTGVVEMGTSSFIFEVLTGLRFEAYAPIAMGLPQERIP